MSKDDVASMSDIDAQTGTFSFIRKERISAKEIAIAITAPQLRPLVANASVST